MHGFALNVNTQLSDYGGIVACGLQDAGITSMSQLLGKSLDMQEVKHAVRVAFTRVFHYD
jgi:lipoyl(octanoyl) transferase